MASEIISQLNGGVALTATASGDKLPITDISDTAEAASGTTKPIAMSDLLRIIFTSLALTGDISPTQITANQNDYNPTGLADAAVLRLSTDAARNITSIAGGADGRILIIFNVGSFDIVLKDDDGSTGTAANRFALSGDTTLSPDRCAILQYDSTSLRWRLLAGPAPAGGVTLHAADHENGGSDEIDVTGLSGVLADPQTPAIHTHASSAITDFDEAVEDKIGAKVVAGSGISVSYNDTTGETTVTNSSPGTGGTIGGSTGATDNAILRADGVGGSTVQSSSVSISDAGAIKGPTQIEDSNGNEVVKYGSTASAVNEVTITNKAAGNAPTIAATGDDTDIDLSLSGKGAGRVKATDFEVTESLRWSGDLSPSQITSDQNDYSPTSLADNAVLRLDTDSNSGAGRSLTGLAGGADGRIITIINIGSNPLRLKAENSSSSAANRFGFAVDLVLGSKRSAVLWYDSTSSRWRLLSTTAIALRHTVAISDETTALATGTAKLTFRFATQVYLLQVRANLNTVSSSGNPAFDVNEAGVSIFSTTLTIDASEKSSETAATPAVISDPNIADDAEITIDIDTAGTGAKGAKLTFIGWEI